ncbi:hypothetical protein JCM10213_008565 [Rhodosporidiobolus nylandii]
MSTPRAVHQGLYALQLPATLLPHLQPRQIVIPADHPLHPSKAPSAAASTSTPLTDADEAHQAGQAAAGEGQFRCALTGASFATLGELKEHYRTDWYRYNVKLKLKGEKTPIGEEEFKRRMEDLSDSLSGSDSDSSASSSSTVSSPGDDNLTRLLSRHTLSSTARQNAEDEEDEYAVAAGGQRSALLWFDTPVAEGEKPTQYGVYRAILPGVGGEKRSSPTEGADALEELKALQLKEGEEEAEERKYTLLMFGGGHFAGMVVALRPRLVGKGKGKEKDREVVVLERKTFHRYTTRRKQGGGQSAHDAGGAGKAKSMGAQLRRHNEMALTEEVRALLSSWQPHIDSSELVFLRCSKSNYRTFFGYDGAVIERSDKRVRGYTFPTRRPTIAELLRSFLELTRVKTTHLTASELAALDASYLSSITPRPAPVAPAPPPPKKEKAPAPPQLSKDEELFRDRWTRLLDMVRKGRLEALGAFLDKYGPELEAGDESEGEGGKPWGSLPPFLSAEAERTPTLLHVASAADQPQVVRWLLEVKRADPTLHPAFPSAPTPFELAPSKQTRSQFRFLAHQQPGWCDWLGTGVGGARVPSGLDEEKEKEKEAKEAAKREKLRAKQAERDAEEAAAAAEEAARKEEQQRREADERAAARSAAGKAGPQRLGGHGGAVRGKMEAREREGLSEQQRMRIEREERARAAEARLKRMQGGA